MNPHIFAAGVVFAVVVFFAALNGLTVESRTRCQYIGNSYHCETRPLFQ